MYVVIDTNVLVSALLKPDSLPGIVMKMVEDELIIPVFDDEIMQEYIDVLHKSKFSFEESIIYNTILNIRAMGMVVSQYSGLVPEKFIDEDDIKFYLVTVESKKKRDTNLVTGNKKHFPIKPFIVSPKELLEIIEKQQ